MWTHAPRWTFVAVAVLTLCACPKKDTEHAELPQADAGQLLLPPPVEFTLRYTLPDAGVEAIPVGGSEKPSIDPTQRLELGTTMGLRNFRIRLFDEADRAMISQDSVEEDPAGLRYQIALPQPLKLGHRYALVLDAQTGASVLDTEGRMVPDQRFEFAIAGVKEKAAPPVAKSKRPRRRR